MKSLLRMVLCGALIMSASAWVMSWRASDAGAAACYSIYAEAESMGSRYRHLVYVENHCDAWLQCTVWTDVNPQPPVMLTVGPGMTEKRETNPDSEVGSPRAFGACRDQ